MIIRYFCEAWACLRKWLSPLSASLVCHTTWSSCRCRGWWWSQWRWGWGWWGWRCWQGWWRWQGGERASYFEKTNVDLMTTMTMKNDSDYDDSNCKQMMKIMTTMIRLWRSVRSCSQTIPEKVRNSRPINMGFKGWGWLLWWSWVTFKPFRYKKFNEWAQTANFSVLSRLRQELCAKKTKKQENKRN